MNHSNIIMYTTEDGLTKIETTFEKDTDISIRSIQFDVYMRFI